MPASTSIVIPVRDNIHGLRRALGSLRNLAEVPKEIIVVDSASRELVTEASVGGAVLPNMRILRESHPGAARARNRGIRDACGGWVLFMDSDCTASRDLFRGFRSAENGAIAYAGNVRAIGQDRVSRYYDSQRILIPPPTQDARPAYLVTANALVWREALLSVGGFDAQFPSAGGEDIDLAYRMNILGDFSYAPEAVMNHDFEPGLHSFIRRFVRYGGGNRILTKKFGVSHVPRPFFPAELTVFNGIAATLQYAAMMAGYASTSLRRR